MKIKLFYRLFNESLEDFETRVNEFMATVEVVDAKISEATEGDRDNMTATTGLLVLYK
ncbi:hypothetical protein [Streptococcus suis]|uniref:hypothetical protein n=1 Tax=Streptococcus suis TaxID=1307 RepID=UPI002FC673C2